MDLTPAPRPSRMVPERTLLFVFLAFLLGFVLPVCSCLGSSLILVNGMGNIAQTSTPMSLATGPAVAVIQVEGVIASEGSLSSGTVTPQQMQDLLEQAASNTFIKAVVLRINSPGGGVVASDEIYRMVQALEKPVIVSMGDMAASGGYYITCAADYVFAHPATLTGSIGVISQFTSMEELMEKIGVEVVVVTSGPVKDIGSPFRDMTAEEQALWQEIIQETYDDFVAIIVDGRGLSEEAVRELADGRIYTGRQALEAGLVDELGTLEDAVEKAAELGGIEGEPQVIELTPPASLYDLMLSYQAEPSFPTMEDLLHLWGLPSLEYRYAGP